MTPSAVGANRRISVVVPCYNRAAYLSVLLRSLTWSSVPATEFEIIVVDDGGVNHAALVVDAWRARGLDVRLTRLRDRGAPRNNAAARNAGIAAARYPVVLQTDPDIVFVTDILGRVRAGIDVDSFGSCDAYLPLTREATAELAFGTEGACDKPDEYLRRARGRPNQVRSPDGVGGLHGAFACAKAHLERVGGYDESFEQWGWEDRELLVTLAHAGLRRQFVPGTTVVHLWHPMLRGETEREALAAHGEASRRAWDLQMQRAAAEFARPSRPRRRRATAGDRASATFELNAYADWTDDDTRAAHEKTRASLDAGRTDDARATHPLAYQLFFDAHEMEARDLAAAGHPALARRLVHVALGRPWEQDWEGCTWQAFADVTAAAGLPAGRALSLYTHVASALETLASCEQQLGDVSARDAALDALARLPGGATTAAAWHVRAALKNGDLPAAEHALGALAGSSWTPATAALALETTIFAGNFEAAARIAAAWACEKLNRGDYFDEVRFAAYAGLLAHVSRADELVLPASARAAAADESEFLYSVAIRSLRGGLYLVACLLLDRFLRSGSPADARLFEEGRLHLAVATAHVARLAASGAAGPIKRAVGGSPGTNRDDRRLSA